MVNYDECKEMIAKVGAVARPTLLHNTVVKNVTSCLDEQLPEGWATAMDFALDLSPLPERAPDFAVVSASAAMAQRKIRLDEVLLIGEVVSPSTRKKDIREHPQMYAGLGKVHYWQIHTEPVFAIYVHLLGSGSVTHHVPVHLSDLFASRGRFTFGVDEPFPLRMDLSRLVTPAAVWRHQSVGDAGVSGKDATEPWKPAAPVCLRVARVNGMIIPLVRPGRPATKSNKD